MSREKVDKESRKTLTITKDNRTGAGIIRGNLRKAQMCLKFKTAWARTLNTRQGWKIWAPKQIT